MSDFFSNIISKGIGDAVTAILLAIIAGLLLWFQKKFSCCRRIRKANNAVAADGNGLWLEFKPKPPQDYRARMRGSIPIMVIANLKGGVGKTTLAANLTASYAARAAGGGSGKPVLAIDLDYQGSLSAMMLTDVQRLPAGGELSKASQLISGQHDGRWLVNAAIPP